MLTSLRGSRKSLFALWLAVLICAPLSACGAPPDAADPTNSPAQQSGSAAPSSPSAKASSGLTAQSSRPGSLAKYSSTSFPMTITDWAGNQTTFTEQPKRVVLVTGTAFNVWYDAGGTAIASTNRTENIKLLPEVEAAMADLPSLGKASALDQEALLALNPDLAIISGNADNATADKLSQHLRGLGINVLNFALRTQDDIYMAYEIFGAINGQHAEALAKAQRIDADVDKVIAKYPVDEHKKIAIIYVTSQALTVKLENSITGEMAKTLGMENVVSQGVPDLHSSEQTPLDVEFFTQHQPDLILVTSRLVNNAEAKARLDANFENNSAWQAIDAVREGRVHYLPQQYFLYHAGPYYADALEYLAACVHPEIFGAPKEP